jgi:hypothetical protein
MTVSNERKGRRHNSLRFTIVATPEEWVHACAVRSICFLDEHGAQAKWLFDGNDYQCTHVLAYDGDEPIGTGRIRWFKDFAKIERTSYRKELRDIRTLKEFAEFGFEHIRRKGYTRVMRDRIMRVYGSRYSASATLKGKNLPLRRATSPFTRSTRTLNPRQTPSRQRRAPTSFSGSKVTATSPRLSKSQRRRGPP